MAAPLTDRSALPVISVNYAKQLLSHKLQTCPSGHHEVIPLENPLSTIKCLPRDSAAIPALWVTAALRQGLSPEELTEC